MALRIESQESRAGAVGGDLIHGAVQFGHRVDRRRARWDTSSARWAQIEAGESETDRRTILSGVEVALVKQTSVERLETLLQRQVALEAAARRLSPGAQHDELLMELEQPRSLIKTLKPG
jgi:hypothetical protein